MKTVGYAHIQPIQNSFHITLNVVISAQMMLLLKSPTVVCATQICTQ